VDQSISWPYQGLHDAKKKSMRRGSPESVTKHAIQNHNPSAEGAKKSSPGWRPRSGRNPGLDRDDISPERATEVFRQQQKPVPPLQQPRPPSVFQTSRGLDLFFNFLFSH
jgi:hypothetical protein